MKSTLIKNLTTVLFLVVLLQGCTNTSSLTEHSVLPSLDNALRRGEIAVIPNNKQILGTWDCHTIMKIERPDISITIESDSINQIDHRWKSTESGSYTVKNHLSNQMGYIKFERHQELSYSVFDINDRFDIVTSYVSLDGRVVEASSNQIGQELKTQYLDELKDNQTIIFNKGIQTLIVFHVEALNENELIYKDSGVATKELTKISVTQCKKINKKPMKNM
jgi:hypothetical protein